MATAKFNGKKVTKFDIAKMIEALPGNMPWGLYSMYSYYCDDFSLKEVVNRYNDLIEERGIQSEKILLIEKK